MEIFSSKKVKYTEDDVEKIFRTAIEYLSLTSEKAMKSFEDKNLRIQWEVTSNLEYLNMSEASNDLFLENHLSFVTNGYSAAEVYGILTNIKQALTEKICSLTESQIVEIFQKAQNTAEKI